MAPTMVKATVCQIWYYPSLASYNLGQKSKFAGQRNSLPGVVGQTVQISWAAFTVDHVHESFKSSRFLLNSLIRTGKLIAMIASHSQCAQGPYILMLYHDIPSFLCVTTLL